MPTYKDINQLTEETNIAGTEKVPVSGTKFIYFTKFKDWIVNSISSLITTNYIPKWDSVNKRFVNSKIFDNGTNVGIGTNNPTSPLDIIYTDANFNAGISLMNDSNHSYALPSLNIKDRHGNTQAQFCYITPLYANPAMRNTVLFNSVYNGVHLGFVTSSGGSADPNQPTTNMGDIYFQTGSVAANKHLFISGTTGRVGVGNTNPSEKLDVVGVVKSSVGFKVGDGTGTWKSVAGLILTAYHPSGTSSVGVSHSYDCMELFNCNSSTPSKTDIDEGGAYPNPTNNAKIAKRNIWTDSPDVLKYKHKLTEGIYGSFGSFPAYSNLVTWLNAISNGISGYALKNNSSIFTELSGGTYLLNLTQLNSNMKMGMNYTFVGRAVGEVKLDLIDTRDSSLIAISVNQIISFDFVKVAHMVIIYRNLEVR